MTNTAKLLDEFGYEAAIHHMTRTEAKKVLDGAETLMVDGDWMIRRSTDSNDVWASHGSCGKSPRRVRDGKCHACQAPAPSAVLGFLNLIEWER